MSGRLSGRSRRLDRITAGLGHGGGLKSEFAEEKVGHEHIRGTSE